jgi:hypothetical protein
VVDDKSGIIMIWNLDDGFQTIITDNGPIIALSFSITASKITIVTTIKIRTWDINSSTKLFEHNLPNRITTALAMYKPLSDKDIRLLNYIDGMKN